MKTSCILALLLCASAPAWSSTTSAPATPTENSAAAQATSPSTDPVAALPSKRALRAQELRRRQEIAEHTSWQWSVVVQSKSKKAKSTEQATGGILIGLQAQGQSGPVRSIGWLNSEGEAEWASLEYPSEDGVAWKFRLGGVEAPWKDDPSGEMLLKNLEHSMGFEADLDTINAWVVGLSKDDRWPRKFVSDQAGIHPLEMRTRQGTITWKNWSLVETGEGFELALPSTWSLVSRRRLAVFQVASIEAYKPDELPNEGWPFVEKGQRKFVIQDEPPVANEDELDYRSW